MLQDVKCENCRFWDRAPDVEAPIGECHRFPPALCDSDLAIWPLMEGDGWCVEHEYGPQEMDSDECTTT